MNIRSLCITEDLDRPTTETFIGLQKNGIQVRVVCPSESVNRQRLVDAGVALDELKFNRQFDKNATHTLRDLLIKQQIDILHVFSNKALQNGLRAVKGLDVKVIAYRGIVGNVSFLSPVSWLRFLNPRVDRIICVCNAIRDYFLNMQPAFLRMPASRPVTIYKGHSLSWYTASPADLTTLGIPADAFCIACVANYRPRKGIEYLVDAIGLLSEDINAHLLLIGNMESDRLERAIETSGAEARIHRLGFRADAPSLTAACDLFVLPSIKREGLARSLIEAMAYGVTPIVSDCGGSPELVVHDVCGLVVPTRDSEALAEAIAQMHSNPEKQKKFGLAARERINTDFRIEKTIEKTTQLYKDLMAG